MGCVQSTEGGGTTKQNMQRKGSLEPVTNDTSATPDTTDSTPSEDISPVIITEGASTTHTNEHVYEEIDVIGNTPAERRRSGSRLQLDQVPDVEPTIEIINKVEQSDTGSPHSDNNNNNDNDNTNESSKMPFITESLSVTPTMITDTTPSSKKFTQQPNSLYISPRHYEKNATFDHLLINDQKTMAFMPFIGWYASTLARAWSKYTLRGFVTEAALDKHDSTAFVTTPYDADIIADSFNENAARAYETEVFNYEQQYRVQYVKNTRQLCLYGNPYISFRFFPQSRSDKRLVINTNAFCDAIVQKQITVTTGSIDIKRNPFPVQNHPLVLFHQLFYNDDLAASHIPLLPLMYHTGFPFTMRAALHDILSTVTQWYNMGYRHNLFKTPIVVFYQQGKTVNSPGDVTDFQARLVSKGAVRYKFGKGNTASVEPLNADQTDQFEFLSHHFMLNIIRYIGFETVIPVKVDNIMKKSFQNWSPVPDDEHARDDHLTPEFFNQFRATVSDFLQLFVYGTYIRPLHHDPTKDEYYAGNNFSTPLNNQYLHPDEGNVHFIPLKPDKILARTHVGLTDENSTLLFSTTSPNSKKTTILFPPLRPLPTPSHLSPDLFALHYIDFNDAIKSEWSKYNIAGNAKRPYISTPTPLATPTGYSLPNFIHVNVSLGHIGSLELLPYLHVPQQATTQNIFTSDDFTHSFHTIVAKSNHDVDITDPSLSLTNIGQDTNLNDNRILIKQHKQYVNDDEGDTFTNKLITTPSEILYTPIFAPESIYKPIQQRGSLDIDLYVDNIANNVDTTESSPTQTNPLVPITSLYSSLPLEVPSTRQLRGDLMIQEVVKNSRYYADPTQTNPVHSDSYSHHLTTVNLISNTTHVFADTPSNVTPIAQYLPLPTKPLPYVANAKILFALHRDAYIEARSKNRLDEFNVLEDPTLQILLHSFITNVSYTPVHIIIVDRDYDRLSYQNFHHHNQKRKCQQNGVEPPAKPSSPHSSSLLDKNDPESIKLALQYYRDTLRYCIVDWYEKMCVDKSINRLHWRTQDEKFPSSFFKFKYDYLRSYDAVPTKGNRTHSEGNHSPTKSPESQTKSLDVSASPQSSSTTLPLESPAPAPSPSSASSTTPSTPPKAKKSPVQRTSSLPKTTHHTEHSNNMHKPEEYISIPNVKAHEIPVSSTVTSHAHSFFTLEQLLTIFDNLWTFHYTPSITHVTESLKAVSDAAITNNNNTFREKVLTPLLGTIANQHVHFLRASLSQQSWYLSQGLIDPHDAILTTEARTIIAKNIMVRKKTQGLSPVKPIILPNNGRPSSGNAKVTNPLAQDMPQALVPISKEVAAATSTSPQSSLSSLSEE